MNARRLLNAIIYLSVMLSPFAIAFGVNAQMTDQQYKEMTSKFVILVREWSEEFSHDPRDGKVCQLADKPLGNKLFKNFKEAQKFLNSEKGHAEVKKIVGLRYPTESWDGNQDTDTDGLTFVSKNPSISNFSIYVSQNKNNGIFY